MKAIITILLLLTSCANTHRSDLFSEGVIEIERMSMEGAIPILSKEEVASFIKRNKKAQSCHEYLQIALAHLEKITPFVVVVCHRGEKEQNEAFEKGNSQVQWPQSLHNTLPSLAVDIVPFIDGKSDFDDIRQIYYNAGRFVALFNYLSRTLNWDGGQFFLIGKRPPNIRWGGDFNCNAITRDTSFHDAYHFELRKECKNGR